MDHGRDASSFSRPAGIDQPEWALRLELAACYRLFDHLGWTEAIFNHITVRVPHGDDATPHYLINPFGLHYSEVTASNLIKIDVTGQAISATGYPVNVAGFVIHSAIHGARPDAHCIMHVHTTAGCAVACKESGLRQDNFYSAMLAGDIAYHEYMGVTTDLSEQPLLVKSLGAANYMILRNHGLLVTGEDVPTAFHRLWTLQRACEVQLASDAGLGPNRQIAPEILQRVPATEKAMSTGAVSNSRRMFDAMVRRAGISYDALA
ncbi:MAG: class II aldolase/adducin family protein [Lautropia sp.]